MIIEGLHETFQQELLEISKLSTSAADRIPIYDSISRKLEENYGVHGLSIAEQVKSNMSLAVLKFKDSNGNVCSVKIQIDNGDFVNTLLETLGSIIYGTKAIQELNGYLHNLRSSNNVYSNIIYIWGYGTRSFVYGWDYSTLKIKLNKEAVDYLCKIYSENRSGFALECEHLINDVDPSLSIGNIEILKCVKDFNSIPFHVTIGALMQGDFIYNMTSNMLSRKEALDICKQNSSKSRIGLLVVERIEQLGGFIALTSWDVNFKSKKVKISLVESKVIDSSTLEIVDNYGICSRIEKQIGLSDSEKAFIFGEGT